MLKDVRNDKGLSQAGLSKLTGIPLRTIQHWEAGHIGRASLESVMAVADALGCTVEDIAAESRGNQPDDLERGTRSGSSVPPSRRLEGEMSEYQSCHRPDDWRAR